MRDQLPSVDGRCEVDLTLEQTVSHLAWYDDFFFNDANDAGTVSWSNTGDCVDMSPSIVSINHRMR